MVFIVLEGLDKAGKTSVAKGLESRIKGARYSKGLTSDTWIGRIAPKMPSTLAFAFELMYITSRIIRPALRKNETILQDRYEISVGSYPTAERWYNRAILSVTRRFLLNPDILLYFTVSCSERIDRLRQDAENRYHAELINNPDEIYAREKRYLKFYNAFEGSKYIIDTTGKSVDYVVSSTMQMINNLYYKNIA